MQLNATLTTVTFPHAATFYFSLTTLLGSLWIWKGSLLWIENSPVLHPSGDYFTDRVHPLSRTGSARLSSCTGTVASSFKREGDTFSSAGTFFLLWRQVFSGDLCAASVHPPLPWKVTFC